MQTAVGFDAVRWVVEHIEEFKKHSGRNWRIGDMPLAFPAAACVTPNDGKSALREEIDDVLGKLIESDLAGAEKVSLIADVTLKSVPPAKQGPGRTAPPGPFPPALRRLPPLRLFSQIPRQVITLMLRKDAGLLHQNRRLQQIALEHVIHVEQFVVVGQLAVEQGIHLGDDLIEQHPLLVLHLTTSEVPVKATLTARSCHRLRKAGL